MLLPPVSETKPRPEVGVGTEPQEEESMPTEPPKTAEEFAPEGGASSSSKAGREEMTMEQDTQGFKDAPPTRSEPRTEERRYRLYFKRSAADVFTRVHFQLQTRHFNTPSRRSQR